MWNRKKIIGIQKKAVSGILAVVLILGGCGGETEVNRHPSEYVDVPSEVTLEEELEVDGKSKGRYEKKRARLQMELMKARRNILTGKPMKRSFFNLQKQYQDNKRNLRDVMRREERICMGSPLGV